MLLFDNWYNQYKGVVCVMAIIDGVLEKGLCVCLCAHECMQARFDKCVGDNLSRLSQSYSSEYIAYIFVLA